MFCVGIFLKIDDYEDGGGEGGSFYVQVNTVYIM
jgi:hypothetical protein